MRRSAARHHHKFWREPSRTSIGACILARQKADLCLVLGSSLRVSPANSIPEVVGQRKKVKLAICNLQSTPLDNDADMRIYARTDDLMIRIMSKLEIPIPPFILQRRLRPRRGIRSKSMVLMLTKHL